MDKLLRIVNIVGIGVSRSTNDDDVIDRFSHRYTTYLFLIFAAVVQTKTYVGDPIKCWAPAHFTKEYAEYTNKVCWITNNYYLPFFQNDIPDSVLGEKQKMINYYQWVPLILLFQAFIFRLPVIFWRTFSRRSGIDVASIVDAGYMLQSLKHDQSKEKIIQFVSKQMDRYLISTREFREHTWYRSLKHVLAKHCFLICGRRYGNYLLGLFILTKFLYLINAALQIYILNTFLNNNFHLYGVDVIMRMTQEEQYSGSYRFPRVTLCDFKVRMAKYCITNTANMEI